MVDVTRPLGFRLTRFRMSPVEFRRTGSARSSISPRRATPRTSSARTGPIPTGWAAQPRARRLRSRSGSIRARPRRCRRRSSSRLRGERALTLSAGSGGRQRHSDLGSGVSDQSQAACARWRSPPSISSRIARCRSRPRATAFARLPRMVRRQAAAGASASRASASERRRTPPGCRGRRGARPCATPWAGCRPRPSAYFVDCGPCARAPARSNLQQDAA